MQPRPQARFGLPVAKSHSDQKLVSFTPALSCLEVRKEKGMRELCFVLISKNFPPIFSLGKDFMSDSKPNAKTQGNSNLQNALPELYGAPWELNGLGTAFFFFFRWLGGTLSVWAKEKIIGATVASAPREEGRRKWEWWKGPGLGEWSPRPKQHS